MDTTTLSQIVPLMGKTSSQVVVAVIGGDASTEALHDARRAVAGWTDRLVGRNRRPSPSARRTELVQMGRAAYDMLAAELAARGAL